MSILLSAYFPEGIVFAADKNVTLLYPGARDVEVGIATKVIPWARRRAVVGFCGLGELASLSVDEWMRQFAGETRDFDDIATLAKQLRDRIQHDFDNTYPEETDIRKLGLIVHLGGFRYKKGIAAPAMFYISNVSGYDKNGRYYNAVRHFDEPKDHFQRDMLKGGITDPSGYRPRLEELYQDPRGLWWYNNGLYFPAFNVLKGALWGALTMIREKTAIPFPKQPSLEDRIAYCKIAVELFGSFFLHHFAPRLRRVGGGADAEWVPWPEQD